MHPLCVLCVLVYVVVCVLVVIDDVTAAVVDDYNVAVCDDGVAHGVVVEVVVAAGGCVVVMVVVVVLVVFCVGVVALDVRAWSAPRHGEGLWVAFFCPWGHLLCFCHNPITLGRGVLP